MKKVYKLFAVIALSAFLLVGCDGLITTTYKELETVETSITAWEFFRNIETPYLSMQEDFYALDSDDISLDAYRELNNNFDNKQNIFRILRDSMAVMDLMYEMQTEAYYSYDTLKDYTVQKDTEIAPNGYRVTYGEDLAWHNDAVVNEKIDGLFEEVVLPMDIESTISTNISGDDSSGILSGYTLDVVQSANFPTNTQDVIDAYSLTNYVDSQNNTHEYTVSFTAQDAENDYELTAKEEVYDESDVLISSYERKVTIEIKSNVKYMTSTITLTDGTVYEKIYRLDQRVSNLVLGFDKTIGKIEWYINYSGQGQMIVSGEAYYQGTNKMLVKEYYNVTETNPSPYGVENSFFTELNINGDIYDYKYAEGDYTEVKIKDQNIYEFGSYTDEATAITLEYISGDSVLTQYS